MLSPFCMSTKRHRPHLCYFHCIAQWRGGSEPLGMDACFSLVTEQQLSMSRLSAADQRLMKTACTWLADPQLRKTSFSNVQGLQTVPELQVKIQKRGRRGAWERNTLSKFRGHWVALIGQFVHAEPLIIFPSIHCVCKKITRENTDSL